MARQTEANQPIDKVAKHTAVLRNTAQMQYKVSLAQYLDQRVAQHPNPFCRYGRKVYSQADEDGLTFEILRRLGLETGTFAEFGVGDGTQNNTLALAAAGWRGSWFGGEELAFSTDASPRLSFDKVWITAENIVSLYQGKLDGLGVDTVDVVSLDLDGNDLYLADRLLQAGCAPQLFIVEYNAKFPPPIRFTIDYNPDHTWTGSDYAGASLSSFDDLFTKHGYALICCNAASGVNAFFVRSEHRPLFPEVPGDIREIYAAPFYNLPGTSGHRTSIRSILALLR